MADKHEIADKIFDYVVDLRYKNSHLEVVLRDPLQLQVRVYIDGSPRYFLIKVSEPL